MAAEDIADTTDKATGEAAALALLVAARDDLVVAAGQGRVADEEAVVARGRVGADLRCGRVAADLRCGESTGGHEGSEDGDGVGKHVGWLAGWWLVVGGWLVGFLMFSLESGEDGCEMKNCIIRSAYGIYIIFNAFNIPRPACLHAHLNSYKHCSSSIFITPVVKGILHCNG